MQSVRLSTRTCSKSLAGRGSNPPIRCPPRQQARSTTTDPYIMVGEGDGVSTNILWKHPDNPRLADDVLLEGIGGLIIALLCLTACGIGQAKILEAKDVQFFKVESIGQTPNEHLRLSGLAFNSAMTVKQIAVERHGSQPAVLVYLELARSGKSGSFTYELTIPSWAQQVTFGTAATIIWSRPS
jgi:hypothetical protein